MMPSPLVLEMAIREISTQCTFAEIAYSNIGQKSTNGEDGLFSSIHSFLSHCAMISKFLRSKHIKGSDDEYIAKILGITSSYKINNRAFRDTLEHYDEYLAEWVSRHGENVNIMDYCIAHEGAVIGSNMVKVRVYNPSTKIYTLIDEKTDLNKLYEEAIDIRGKADSWIKDNTRWQ